MSAFLTDSFLECTDKKQFVCTVISYTLLILISVLICIICMV